MPPLAIIHLVNAMRREFHEVLGIYGKVALVNRIAWSLTAGQSRA